MEQTPFQKWLIKHRIFCEYRDCLRKASKVLNINGRDEVRCSFHGYQPKPNQQQLESQQK